LKDRSRLLRLNGSVSEQQCKKLLGVCIRNFWKSRENNKNNQAKEGDLPWYLSGAKILNVDKPKLWNKTKKFVTRNGFILANVILVITVVGIVWVGRSSTFKPISLPLLSQNGDESSLVPLDIISSADIAANIATVTSLPEAVAVINQADSLEIYLSNSIKINQAIVTKPQIVTGGTKSRKDIQVYIAVAGDTVSSLATKFGVTSDSIKWSNGLYSNYVAVGTELRIPPVNGIVYMVRSGDTLDALVSRFQATKEIMVAFNDIEISGLPVGEYIVVPNGVQSYYTSSIASYSYTPQWAGNGYYYGYCTYYAATKVKVPSNWGNANTWDDYARLSGWIVSSTPVVGAVAQTDTLSYWGHVAYVEEVSADGLMMRYSDMNALCGWGCVGYSGWTPINFYQNYIYR
jgi:surface antigen